MSTSALFQLVAKDDVTAVTNHLRPLTPAQREAELDEVQVNLFFHASTDRVYGTVAGYDYYQFSGWYTKDLSAMYRANTPRALNPELVEKAVSAI